MALPFLPEEHITSAFRSLTAHLSPSLDPRIPELITYVQDTWVCSQLWPPKCWSAFRSSVRLRTNNDVEGWHNRLNQKTRRGHLDVYQLSWLSYKEARYVDVQARLVSESRLRRYQKKTYEMVQGRLDEYWSLYGRRKLTTSALLRKCAKIYKPVQ